MKNRICIMALVLAFPVMLYAQDFTKDWGNYSQPSPDLFSSTIQNKVDVSEVTGAASMNIPMYDLKQNYFSLPISLSYYSAGFRVDENAPRTGLGWSLSAGGQITRIIKGLPDETPVKGYSTTYNQTISINDITSGNKDAEPDMYAFNFCGRSGKFYINPSDGQIYLISNEALKIEFASPAIIITDESGTKFYFELQEVASMYNLHDNTVLQAPAVSGFFLTRIVLTDHTEITLGYDDISFEMFGGVRESEIAKKQYEPEEPCADTRIPDKYQRTSLVFHYDTYRIKTISFSSGSLQFFYDNNRLDLIDKSLDRIELYDKNDIRIDQTRLSYTYSSGRLLLQSVKTSDGSNNDIDKYEFTYYTNFTVPIPGSCQSQDYWGYFNNAPVALTSNSRFSGTTTLIPEHNGVFLLASAISGADRTPNETYVHALMLKKVSFPTGSSSEFTYEQPTCWQHDNNLHTQVLGVGPGARVSAVQVNDGNGKIHFKKYNYQEGYAFIQSELSMLQTTVAYRDNDENVYIPCTAVFRQSELRTRLNTVYSTSIYHRVVEVITCSDLQNISTTKLGSVKNTYSYDPNMYNTIPQYNNKEYQFGNLETSEVFDKDANMVSKTYNYYTYSNLNSISGKASFLKVVSYDAGPRTNDYIYDFVPYTIWAATKKIDYIEQYDFSLNSNVSIKTKTDFTYSNTDYPMLPTAKKLTLGDGSTLTDVYKRCVDYIGLSPSEPTTAPLHYMLTRHIIAPVIEQVSIKDIGTGNEKVVSASLSIPAFNFVADVVTAGKNYKLKITTPITFSNFVPSGPDININNQFAFSPDYELTNEVTQTYTNGIPTETNSRNKINSVVYDYAGTTPLMQAADAGYNDIGYIGFESYESVKHLTSNEYNNPKWYAYIGGGCTAIAFSTDAFAGNSSFDLALNSCDARVFFGNNLTSSRTYKVTLWSKDGTPVLKNQSGTAYTAVQIGSANGWNLYEYTFTGATALVLNGSGLVDEIKLFPLGASVSNIVYKPLIGIVSQSGPDNRYQFFEYDIFGRVRTAYDHNKNIIKRYEYAQKEAQ